MSVLVDGISISYGETISRTGTMLVTADNEFTVEQDGRIWSPIGFVDGASQYIVNSNGRISVTVDGKEVFYFIVSFVPDFIFGTNNLFQKEGTTNIASAPGGTNYVQTRFLENANGIDIFVRPTSISPSDLLDVETFCNQEVTLSKRLHQTDFVAYELRGVDSSTYLQFSAGNVLLAFVRPA